jgi:hypothetical protein
MLHKIGDCKTQSKINLPFKMEIELGKALLTFSAKIDNTRFYLFKAGVCWALPKQNQLSIPIDTCSSNSCV